MKATSALTSASWHLRTCPGVGVGDRGPGSPPWWGLKVLEGGAPGQNSGVTAAHLLKTLHLTTQDAAQSGRSRGSVSASEGPRSILP